MNSLRLQTTEISTPLGILFSAATDKGICRLEFLNQSTYEASENKIQKVLNAQFTHIKNPHLTLLKKEIDEYFNGSLQQFTVPLDLMGTDFQKQVWNELLTIPYGETRSYEKQSLNLGDIKAIRAVASANGKNNIAIIVPCHRVIGKNGSLTGYAGGLDKKKWLLDFEAKNSGKSFQTSLEF